MTTRIPVRARACSALALVPAPAAAAATVPAKLRVLTPDATSSTRARPTTSPDDITVPTTPEADCFGASRRLRRRVHLRQPERAQPARQRGADDRTSCAARAHRPVRIRARHLRDRRRGGRSARPFWYFKVNHEEAVGRRRPGRAQEGRRGPVLPRAGRLPQPEPGRARAQGARRRQGGHAVRRRGRRAQVRHRPGRRSRRPAPAARPPGSRSAAATRTRPPAPTAPRRSTVDEVGVASSRRRAAPTSRRRRSTPASGPSPNSCPTQRGKRIVGSPRGRQDQGHLGSRRDPLARRRRHRRRPQGRRRHRQLRRAASDTVLLKRATASDGLVIKGSCEKVKRGGARAEAPLDAPPYRGRGGGALRRRRDRGLRARARASRARGWRRSRSPATTASEPIDRGDRSTDPTAVRDRAALPRPRGRDHDPLRRRLRAVDRRRSRASTERRPRARLVLLRQRHRVVDSAPPRSTCAAATGSGGTTATGPTPCALPPSSARGRSRSRRRRPADRRAGRGRLPRCAAPPATPSQAALDARRRRRDRRRRRRRSSRERAAPARRPVGPGPSATRRPRRSRTDPATSGVFARFERDGDGWQLVGARSTTAEPRSATERRRAGRRGSRR